MSWDIFVMDFPRGLTSIEEIPSDFKPPSIGSRDEIIASICEVVPDADFSDPTWGTIEGSEYSIEVNMGDGPIIDSFAFHVRGGDEAAAVVARILDHLDLRAVVPGSPTGFFEPGPAAVESLRKWRAFRDSRMKSTEQQ